MLWSRSFTNLLFFSFSFLSLRRVSECMAGERLPALAGSARWRGLTGEGVARWVGTAGGGTTSTTCTASLGRGREEGRGTVLSLVLGLSGITPPEGGSSSLQDPRVLAHCIFPWHSLVQIFLLKLNIFHQNILLKSSIRFRTKIKLRTSQLSPGEVDFLFSLVHQ